VDLRRGLVVTAVLGAACASPRADHEEASAAFASAEVLTEAQFRRAREVVDAIDYVPFGYTKDGCFARALYVSLELAAARLESNSVFVFPPVDAPGLAYPGAAGADLWRYHVAPLVEVDVPGARETVVVDPSLAPRPLALDAWLGLMKVSWDSARVVVLKGAVYGGGEGARRVSSLHAGSWRQELTESFEDMPPFDVRDVQAACEAADGFLTVEAASRGAPPSTVQEARARATEKIAKLHVRTKELLESVARASKLTGSPSAFSAERCASEGRALAMEQIFRL